MHVYLQSITNTFQGILITDGSSSYAVFIYECGGMKWGGGVIGWQASTSHYNSFYTSKLSYNNNIGCLYSTTSSAIVFKINDSKCLTAEDFSFISLLIISLQLHLS